MAIFILHHDVDVLARLVGALRSRGLETVHDTQAEALLERTRRQPVDLLIAPRAELIGEADKQILLRMVGAAEVLYLDDTSIAPELLLERVAQLLTENGPRAYSTLPPTNDLRGDLAHMGLADLFQLLSMNQQSGTLVVNTSISAGEVHFLQGEIVDVMFQRAEGFKALVRLLGQKEGTFHFTTDTTPVLRRMTEATSSLLLEAFRQQDEVKRLIADLGSLAPSSKREHLAFYVDRELAGWSGKVPTPLTQDVIRALEQPTQLDELLDKFPNADLDILHVLGECKTNGQLKLISLADVRPSLAGPEGMVLLRGLLRRLRHRGFRGPARIVLSAKRLSMALIRKLLTQLAESSASNEMATEFAADRLIESTTLLHLGERTYLEVMTVVDDPSLECMIALVAAGSIVWIEMEPLSAKLIEELDALEVVRLNALHLSLQATSEIENDLKKRQEQSMQWAQPSELALLLRTAIERLAEA